MEEVILKQLALLVLSHQLCILAFVLFNIWKVHCMHVSSVLIFPLAWVTVCRGGGTWYFSSNNEGPSHAIDVQSALVEWLCMVIECNCLLLALVITHACNCSSLEFEQVFVGFGQQHCDGRHQCFRAYLNCVVFEFQHCVVPPHRPKHITINIKNNKHQKEACEVSSFILCRQFTTLHLIFCFNSCYLVHCYA